MVDNKNFDEQDNDASSLDQNTNDGKTAEQKEQELEFAKRLTPTDYYNQRQAEKAKKASADNSGYDDDDDNNQSFNDPVINQVQNMSLQMEMNALLSQYPDAKDLSKDILKASENYPQVPLSNIYHMVKGMKGNNFLSKQEADERARQSSLGSNNSPRNNMKSDEKLPDFSNMSNDDFNKWKLSRGINK